MERVASGPSIRYGWDLPALTRAGQEVFWDRQAVDYEKSDMTNDNEGELALVRLLTKQYVDAGYALEDIVTFGGAVGSRDPLVITDYLKTRRIRPARVYFNDLSLEMTERAQRVALASYEREGLETQVLTGRMHEVRSSIPSMPRRIILGVNRLESLYTALPHYQYERTGVEEYAHAADHVGSQLTYQPVRALEPFATTFNMRCDVFASSREGIDSAHEMLASVSKMSSIEAVRVIGQEPEREGFFLSQWFSETGIRALLATAFRPEQMERMSIAPCAKGFVICIDPIERPRGIITMLNNVLGNVLPMDLPQTLETLCVLSN